MNEAKIVAILKDPLVDLNDHAGRGNCRVTEELQEAERRAAALATHYARVSAYLSRRMSGGRHDAAVQAQNRTARKVRQALGYTYADDKITF